MLSGGTFDFRFVTAGWSPQATANSGADRVMSRQRDRVFSYVTQVFCSFFVFRTCPFRPFQSLSLAAILTTNTVQTRR